MLATTFSSPPIPTDNIGHAYRRGKNWRFFSVSTPQTELSNYDIISLGKTRAGRLTLSFGGATLQTKERREMSMYVTYTDLIQTGTFIVALVGLCYQVFKGKRK